MADDNKELTWQEKQDAKRKENEQKRQERSQQYSNEAIDAAAKWMEDNQVDSLDEQSISSILTPKQLWHFQKNNRNEGAGSNWGNAFGSHVFFGDVNDGTVSLLNKKALEKKNANVAQANKDRVSTAITKAVPYGDATINISNKNIDDMRLWGDNIKDSDNISAEQAVDLYSRLESMGVAVPKKDIPVLDKNGKPQKDKDGNLLTTKVYDLEGKTSLYDLLDDLDADEALGVLGLLDDTGYVTPHHETFEEKLARAERNREKLELLNKQRALQRQQARLGMSDLAAGIGDMIKASGGAIVDPRDYKAMYDTLTAQQQKNFDNYLARMQKMKDEEKAKQKEAADRAYQERLLAEQRAYQEEQARKAQEFQTGESKKDREHQESMLSDRLAAQKEIQLLKNQNAIDRLHLNIDSKEASNSAKYGTSIPFDGEIIPIKPNLSDGLYQGIYGYIEPVIRNHPAFVNELASIDKAYLETDPKAVRIIVANALTNPTVNITAEMKAAIRKLINDAKVQQKEGDAGSQGITIPKEANLVEQVMSTSPEEIVTSWWKP